MDLGQSFCNAAIREALRAGDILVDFSIEARPDPRGCRSLVRELAESLTPVPREASPLQARLKSASDYIQAGLSAVVPTGIGTAPNAAPIQE